MKKQLSKFSQDKNMHPTRPARLEGKVKNHGLNQVRKKKKGK